MSHYQQQIQQVLGCDRDQALGVEAYMRLDRSTLDGLSKKEFDALARDCLADVKADPKQALELARSFGLCR